MDYDRELEHVMMNVRGNMGSITQVVYAANMGKIKLIQFIARMAKKGYLSLKSRNDIEAFSRLSDGKYNIYIIYLCQVISALIRKDLKGCSLNSRIQRIRHRSNR